MSPASPPPRPKARMATAGGSGSVQTPLLEAGLSSMFHHRLVRPAKFRWCLALVPSFVGSSSQKTPPLHVKGKSAGKAAARQHTLSLYPPYNTSTSRQSISPQIDEISQTCLFQSPALLTPACSSRATQGVLFPLQNNRYTTKHILKHPPATTPRMAPSFATSRLAVTSPRPCRHPLVPTVATRLSSTTCRK